MVSRAHGDQCLRVVPDNRGVDAELELANTLDDVLNKVRSND